MAQVGVIPDGEINILSPSDTARDEAVIAVGAARHGLPTCGGCLQSRPPGLALRTPFAIWYGLTLVVRVIRPGGFVLAIFISLSDAVMAGEHKSFCSMSRISLPAGVGAVPPRHTALDTPYISGGSSGCAVLIQQGQLLVTRRLVSKKLRSGGMGPTRSADHPSRRETFEQAGHAPLPLRNSAWRSLISRRFTWPLPPGGRRPKRHCWRTKRVPGGMLSRAWCLSAKHSLNDDEVMRTISGLTSATMLQAALVTRRGRSACGWCWKRKIPGRPPWR